MSIKRTNIIQATLALAANCTTGKPAKAFGGKKASDKAPPAPPATPEAPVEVQPPKRPKLKFTKEIILLSALTFSHKHQAREKLNAEAVAEYTEKARAAKEKGADSPFPPLKAIRRGEETFVFSGFTRGASLKKAEYEETAVEVAVNNDITDAELFHLAVEANAEHGARLTTQDKYHNLARAVKFPEFAELSNTALADVVGCSEFFVRQHRPANTAKATRVSKTGKKIATTGIGKKGGKKKPAAKKTNAAQGDLPGTGGASTDPNKAATDKAKLDDESARNLGRICTTIDGKLGYKGAEVRKAIEDGTIKLSAPDLKVWATNSDARVLQLAPLVIGLGWSPKKAISHIDKAVTDQTKVEHLINTAISYGGINKRNSVVPGEPVEGSPYIVVAYDETKYKATFTPIKGEKTTEAPATGEDTIQ